MSSCGADWQPIPHRISGRRPLASSSAVASLETIARRDRIVVTAWNRPPSNAGSSAVEPTAAGV
jgi:hypothetical protein